MLLKRKNSPNYYAKIYIAPGKFKLVSTGTPLKYDAKIIHDTLVDNAKRERRQMRLRRLTGENVQQVELIKFEDAWKKAILVTKSLPERTLETFTRFCKWVQKEYRLKTINEIDQVIAFSYFQKVYTTAAPKTVNTYKSAMSRLWKTFSVYGIKENPFAILPNKEGGVQNKYRALSDQELAIFIKNTPVEWKNFMIIAYYTGLRLKDMSLLKWESVKFKEDAIVLIPAKTSRFHRPVYIHLHPIIKTILTSMAQNDIYIFPFAQKGYGSYTFHRMIQKIMLTSDIKDNDHGKASFHSLRTTLISNCKKAGIDIKVIGGIAGHANERTTEGYIDDKESGKVIKTLRNISIE